MQSLEKDIPRAEQIDPFEEVAKVPQASDGNSDLRNEAELWMILQVNCGGAIHRIYTMLGSAVRALPATGLSTVDHPPVKIEDRAMAAFLAHEQNEDDQLGVFPTIDATAEVEALGEHVKVHLPQFVNQRGGGVQGIPNTMAECSAPHVAMQYALRGFV